MPTKVCVEIEVDTDVSPAGLAAWFSESLNGNPCVDQAVPAADLDAMDLYDRPVRVTLFEPVMSEPCWASPPSIYPPATEQPEPEQDALVFRALLPGRVVKHFGVEQQARKLSEECGELLAAVSRFLDGRCSGAEVAEEAADVAFLLLQLPYIVDFSGRTGRDGYYEAYDNKLAAVARVLASRLKAGRP